MKKLSLLPLSTCEFSKGLESLIVEADGVVEDELILELEGDFERWIQSYERSTAFPPRLQKLLRSAEWPSESVDLGKQYPLLYRKLEKSSGIPSILVLALLSHLNLIRDLVCNHQFSSARACQVIAALDERLEIDFKTMGVILREIGVLPKLSIELVRDTLSCDKRCAEVDYGDSGLADLACSLRDLGDSLHLSNEFGQAVERLINPQTDLPNIPYLQILMCVCAVVPFFDHPTEILYEFAPRGQFGNLVMDEFPKDLVHTKSAMLNNTKSVYRLSEDWARPKKGFTDQAFALVEIVRGLSSLSYSARKILAEAIRRAIFRSLEVLTPARLTLLKVESKSDLEAILRSMEGRNTVTAGILEQRITDFLAEVSLAGGNWRVRGLGDSVNASNTASKKLGDLDFQDATNLKCEAFEAHGGKLNAAYFNDHILTLEQTLKHRVLEWEKLGEIEKWGCHVTFIAHEFSGIRCEKSVIEGVACSFTLKTFTEANDEVLGSSIAEQELVKIFNKVVVESLNRPGCAHAIRLLAVEKFCFKTNTA